MRTVEITDDERRILLRLLGDAWNAADLARGRGIAKDDRELRYLADIESLQRKLI